MIKQASSFIAVLILCLLTGACSTTEDTTTEPTKSVLRHTMPAIDGKAVYLSQYEDQVVLIVNVASKCGFTPQYEELEALYQRYKDQGFVVLGFPANNFMGQEPGTNEEIKAFCSTNYGVTFPMFAKISVKGDDMAPLYKDLVSDEYSGRHSGDIKWNFNKFLLDRDGIVRARFGSKTKPLAPEVIQALEAAL